jgi:uncharacterized membrane-anchored protein
MVLMVLGYVLRSLTFGWTGAAACVAAGSVLFSMVLHVEVNAQKVAFRHRLNPHVPGLVPVRAALTA